MWDIFSKTWRLWTVLHVDKLSTAGKGGATVTFFATAGLQNFLVRRSLLVREVWGSNPEPIKSPTLCQRFATVATLIVWTLAQSRRDGHRSLVTPERILSEYNDLIFFEYIKKKKS